MSAMGIRASTERVLSELNWYTEPLPLSDMLHLGKHFINQFLKYELMFSHSSLSKSTDRSGMHKILQFGAPLTDFNPVGKMRDAYLLVISPVEQIIALFQNDAITREVA
jgi:hypothetical protein